jgi:hypothetical protein
MNTLRQISNINQKTNFKKGDGGILLLNATVGYRIRDQVLNEHIFEKNWNNGWKYSGRITAKGFRKKASEPYAEAAVAMQTEGHKLLRATNNNGFNPCNRKNIPRA